MQVEIEVLGDRSPPGLIQGRVTRFCPAPLFGVNERSERERAARDRCPNRARRLLALVEDVEREDEHRRRDERPVRDLGQQVVAVEQEPAAACSERPP